MNARNALVLIMLATMLIGCGKKSGTQTANEKSSSGSSTESKYQAPSISRKSLQPIDKYVSFDLLRGDVDTAITEARFRKLYWSAASRNDDLLAYDFLPEYRKETDSFKRADIIKSSKEKLDSAFHGQQNNNLFALEVGGENDSSNSARVFKYDAQEKGFRVALFRDEQNVVSWMKPSGDKNLSGKSWGVRIIGGRTDDHVYYHPKDEAEARQIESKLAVSNEDSLDVKASLLGRTVGALKPTDILGETELVLFVVDGVQIRSPKDGAVIFTIDKTQLGDSAIVECESTAQVFGLKMETSLRRGENCGRR